MAMTLTGFVYDNAGNAISGATVQGYVSADDQTSGTTAEASTTTNSDGKWAITTSTAARIPMDVLITYGSNKRWIKAGDKVNLTDMTVTGTLTVGEDAAGFDFALYSADSAGDGLTWDASEEVLQITGKNGATSLDVLDGDVRIVDKLYFYDRGGEYLSSDGSTLTITGAVTIGALSLTSMSSNWTNASRTVADMGIVTTIDINGGTIDGAVIGGASAAAVTGTAVTGTSLVGGTVAGTTGTFSGVVDITLVTDASDATGDTGALRTEGGASIAKKLYVGTDVSVGNDLTVAGDLTVSGDTITVNTATLAVEDPLIALATGNDSDDALDIGIYGLYDTSGSQDEYSGLFRDATDEKWKLFQDLQVAPTTTVNTGGAGYAVGTLVATLEGNVTGNVTGNASGTAATVTGGTQAAITTLANVVTVGALTGGSIASGFGTINNGSNTITTSGVITAGGFTIGSAAILEAELEILDGASVTTDELNLLDGDTSVGGSITLANGDGFVVNDGGVMKTIPASDINTYVGDSDTTYTAASNGGIGLSGTAFSLDVDGMTDIGAGVASGDLFIVDDGAGGANRKTTVDRIATLFAGTGLTASSSVIGVDAAQTQITSVGDLGTGTIAAGFGVIDNGTSGIRTNTFTAETSIIPSGVGTADIGSTSAEWGDVFIADDKKIKFGSDQDATIEYDEDGTDELRIVGDTIFENNVSITAGKSIKIGGPAEAHDYSTDDTGYGITVTFEAGGAVTLGQAVYVDSDGNVQRANAQVSSVTSPAIGVALNTASSGSTVNVLVLGIFREASLYDFSSSNGSPVYLGESAGALTKTAPSTDGDYVQRIGIALDDDMLFVMPSIDVIEHA